MHDSIIILFPSPMSISNQYDRIKTYSIEITCIENEAFRRKYVSFFLSFFLSSVDVRVQSGVLPYLIGTVFKKN